jgi:hypothetical protein
MLKKRIIVEVTDTTFVHNVGLYVLVRQLPVIISGQSYRTQG